MAPRCVTFDKNTVVPEILQPQVAISSMAKPIIAEFKFIYSYKIKQIIAPTHIDTVIHWARLRPCECLYASSSDHLSWGIFCNHTMPGFSCEL